MSLVMNDLIQTTIYQWACKLKLFNNLWHECQVYRCMPSFGITVLLSLSQTTVLRYSAKLQLSSMKAKQIFKNTFRVKCTQGFFCLNVGNQK